MPDPWKGYSTIASQAERWSTATGLLSDTVALVDVPKAIRFKAAGNVSLVGSDGVAVTVNVASGETLDWRPIRINATGTDIVAANIILLF